MRSKTELIVKILTVVQSQRKNMVLLANVEVGALQGSVLAAVRIAGAFEIAASRSKRL